MQNVNILFLSRRNPDGWRILYPFNFYLNIEIYFDLLQMKQLV